MRSIAAALLLAAPLLSCAITRTTGHQFQRLEPPREGYAVLYLYAPQTGMPVLGQMSTAVLVDGEKVTRIDEGFYARVELAPGTHSISASTDTQMGCGGESVPGRRYPLIDVSTDAGQTLAMRYSAHPVRKATTCDRYLKLIDVDLAEHEMRGLKEARTR